MTLHYTPPSSVVMLTRSRHNSLTDYHPDDKALPALCPLNHIK